MTSEEYLDYLITCTRNYEQGFSSYPPSMSELELLKRILIDEKKTKEKK